MRRIFSGRNVERNFVWRLLGAVALLHVVVLLPTWPGSVGWRAFMYLPLELPALILLFAGPRGGWAPWLRGLLITVLAVVMVLKIANIVAFLVFARPFNPVVDPFLLPIAFETLAKNNILLVVAAAVACVVLIGAIVALFVWSGRVLSSPSHRKAVVGVGLVLAVVTAGVWAAPRAVPALAPMEKWTMFDAVPFVREQVKNTVKNLAAKAEFKKSVAEDPFRDFPSDRLLTQLKGKDVLLIFVESYGRAAILDPDGAPSRLLTRMETELADAGYAMRSAWLTSPTFGGASWLAHSTLVSGLWIDDHQRYNSLFVSKRQTLIGDFERAGWRTTAVMPLFTRAWPEGQFFGYDKIYMANDLGYQGPSFGYVTMPDQYTLLAFARRELTPLPRKPVMLEMALASSHLPWTPRAHFVPWDRIGGGEVYADAREGAKDEIDWLSPARMQSLYTKAITYSMESVFSFAATQVHDPALIIIVGDHQPIPIVSGNTASHEVPVHVLSRDPSDLAAFAAWTPGLRPDAQSPIWPMDAVRANILRTYSDAPPFAEHPRP